ncbi:MAG: methyltransferase domain-containing protein [Phycisphaerales bacterium]
MDDPQADPRALKDALGYLRKVNRRLGGEATLIGQLNRWAVDWPVGARVELLDIATGSADLPIAACRWADSRGFDLRITAVDIHATTLRLAGEEVARAGLSDRVVLEEVSAMRLMDRYSFDSFDYVHAGLFLHHLPELEIVTVLRIMDRLARRGILWNDLIRSRVGLWFITAATMFAAEMPRHDARASVRAAFTKREALGLAQSAGIERATYRGNLLTHRFGISTTKRFHGRPLPVRDGLSNGQSPMGPAAPERR